MTKAFAVFVRADGAVSFHQAKREGAYWTVSIIAVGTVRNALIFTNGQMVTLVFPDPLLTSQGDVISWPA